MENDVMKKTVIRKLGGFATEHAVEQTQKQELIKLARVQLQGFASVLVRYDERNRVAGTDGRGVLKTNQNR
ncbi:MAG: hypothetical protein M1321_00355 [Candidatus Marsarchaeota archaeon]|nr:hypothetical protein [Candidatus Marsarchaeota archaeon]